LGDSKREVYIPSVSLHGSRTWREGSFNWNSESFVRHVKKALDMENLSPYSGFMRGTWREGSYTDD
jgi:hypothetical protein